MNAVDRIIAISRGEKPKEERKPNGNARAHPPLWKGRTFGADTLQDAKFPPLTYLLPDLIPEGLCLLVSRPKLGKSWLALDIAIATSADRFVLGTLKPAIGEVLYLALEDGKRRLQRRLSKLLPSFNGKWPQGLTFATEWPRSDHGGLADIEGWICATVEAGKHPRLIIIDTLAHFRKPGAGKNAYLEDYEALGELQKLASKYNLAIVVVHHDRKASADDVFDTVSGTLGITGPVDTIAIMKREAGGVTLHIIGRDIEGAEKAIQFNKEMCRWTILGEAADIRRTDERARVLAALDGLVDGMSPSDLSVELGISSGNARVTLHRMAKAGEIKRSKYGKYIHPNAAVTPVTPSQQQKNDSKIRPIAAESVTITGVTAPVTTAIPVTLAPEGSPGLNPIARPPDYLGTPGDNPADFLGDIPAFLRRT